MNQLESNSTGSPARIVGPIEGEINRIDNRIEQIGEAIMALRGSLSAVLRDEAPVKAEDPMIQREIEQSPMHAVLRDYGDRLENLNRSVMEIVSRVTL